jgi:hypothetical protein
MGRSLKKEGSQKTCLGKKLYLCGQQRKGYIKRAK